jgi:hypothetical protein
MVLSSLTVRPHSRPSQPSVCPTFYYLSVQKAATSQMALRHLLLGYGIRGLPKLLVDFYDACDFRMPQLNATGHFVVPIRGEDR